MYTDDVGCCDVPVQVLEYEYDPDMEETYRQSFFKTFKKQVENNFFSFIIVDAVFEQAKFVEQFYTHARTYGFQVNSVIQPELKWRGYVHNIIMQS